MHDSWLDIVLAATTYYSSKNDTWLTPVDQRLEDARENMELVREKVLLKFSWPFN
jgi:hypothetical protein